MRRFLVTLFLLLAAVVHAADEVSILAPLVDPAKVDTLSAPRAANPRLKKICYWLEMARRGGQEPAAVIEAAQKADGVAGTPRAAVERAALVRNLTILDRLGCLTDEGMAALRKGNSPKITKGPYAGDIASVDHIIPRAVAPELDLKLYNLEIMPERMNREKSATVGQRQVALAKEWAGKGLLSQAGLQAVLAADR